MLLPRVPISPHRDTRNSVKWRKNKGCVKGHQICSLEEVLNSPFVASYFLYLARDLAFNLNSEKKRTSYICGLFVTFYWKIFSFFWFKSVACIKPRITVAILKKNILCLILFFRLSNNDVINLSWLSHADCGKPLAQHLHSCQPGRLWRERIIYIYR